jgi:hypothetical protein
MVNISAGTTVMLYKIARGLVVAAALAGGGYMAGSSRAEVSCEKELRKDIAALLDDQAEQLELQNKEVEERLKIADKAARSNEELKSKIDKLRGQLNEAIDARPPNSACAPTPDEHRLYSEAASKTRD